MKTFHLLLSLLFLSACETTGTLTPLTSNGQTELMRDGQQAILSTKKNAVALSTIDSEVTDGARGSFLIVVSNKDKSSFLVSPSNVQATTFASTAKARSTERKEDNSVEPSVPAFESASDASGYLAAYKTAFPERLTLKVYKYEELAEEEEDRAAMQAVAIALGGIGDSMAATRAGYQSGHGTFNTYGAGTTFGSYNYTSYNHGAAQAARNAAEAKTSAKFAEASARHETEMARLTGMLKEHTLLPGESYGGVVQIDLPSFAKDGRSSPLLIEVTTGNETHTFVYKLKKRDDI